MAIAPPFKLSESANLRADLFGFVAAALYLIAVVIFRTVPAHQTLLGSTFPGMVIFFILGSVSFRWPIVGIGIGLGALLGAPMTSSAAGMGGSASPFSLDTHPMAVRLLSGIVLFAPGVYHFRKPFLTFFAGAPPGAPH